MRWLTFAFAFVPFFDYAHVGKVLPYLDCSCSVLKQTNKQANKRTSKQKKTNKQTNTQLSKKSEIFLKFGWFVFLAHYLRRMIWRYIKGFASFPFKGTCATWNRTLNGSPNVPKISSVVHWTSFPNSAFLM